MKKIQLLLLLVILIGCSEKHLEANYYKNLYTGEVLTKLQFEAFEEELIQKYNDLNEQTSINYQFFKLEKSGDSVIRKFKYDLRVGTNYMVRSRKYEKIGTKIPEQNFTALNGDTIQIGGKQEKPTVINLWFVNCPGCIEEMPSLNRLQEKYTGKVNFVSMTFEREVPVLTFLKKKAFDFKHVVNVEEYIEEIGSYPYPETIFIDKNGVITNIEGGLGYVEETDLDASIEYFSMILDENLK